MGSAALRSHVQTMDAMKAKLRGSAEFATRYKRNSSWLHVHRFGFRTNVVSIGGLKPAPGARPKFTSRAEMLLSTRPRSPEPLPCGPPTAVQIEMQPKALYSGEGLRTRGPCSAHRGFGGPSSVVDGFAEWASDSCIAGCP